MKYMYSLEMHSTPNWLSLVAFYTPQDFQTFRTRDYADNVTGSHSLWPVVRTESSHFQLRCHDYSDGGVDCP